MYEVFSCYKNGDLAKALEEAAGVVRDMGEMQHGDRRNERIEQSVGNPRTLITSSGQEIRTPLFAVSESVSDRWCATCGTWVEARGIIGGLVCPRCHTATRI